MKYVVKNLEIFQISKDTSKLFMKERKTTNVKHVAKNLVYFRISKYTLKMLIAKVNDDTKLLMYLRGGSGRRVKQFVSKL